MTDKYEESFRKALEEIVKKGNRNEAHSFRNWLIYQKDKKIVLKRGKILDKMLSRDYSNLEKKAPAEDMQRFYDNAKIIGELIDNLREEYISKKTIFLQSEGRKELYNLMEIQLKLDKAIQDYKRNANTILVYCAYHGAS